MNASHYSSEACMEKSVVHDNENKVYIALSSTFKRKSKINFLYNCL
jgi:hypothetical protein